MLSRVCRQKILYPRYLIYCQECGGLSINPLPKKALGIIPALPIYSLKPLEIMAKAVAAAAKAAVFSSERGEVAQPKVQVELTDEIYEDLWMNNKLVVKIAEALGITPEVMVSKSGTYYLSNDTITEVDNRLFKPQITS